MQGWGAESVQSITSEHETASNAQNENLSPTNLRTSRRRRRLVRGGLQRASSILQLRAFARRILTVVGSGLAAALEVERSELVTDAVWDAAALVVELMLAGNLSKSRPTL